MGMYQMAVSQSEHNEFPWGRIMNNIPRSRKNGNFVTMETVTFSIRSSEKNLFALITEII